jgi:hypothetical protein
MLSKKARLSGVSCSRFGNVGRVSSRFDFHVPINRESDEAQPELKPSIARTVTVVAIKKGLSFIEVLSTYPPNAKAQARRGKSVRTGTAARPRRCLKRSGSAGSSLSFVFPILTVSSCAIRANEITKAAIQWLRQSYAFPAKNCIAMMREPLLGYVQIV